MDVLSVGKIWLFCKAWVVGWLVRLCKCAKCALAEIFKNAKRGLFPFSSRSVILVRLHCWSSRVSPVLKSVCVTICVSLLVIVNVSVVFFACAPTCLYVHHRYTYPTKIGWLCTPLVMFMFLQVIKRTFDILQASSAYMRINLSCSAGVMAQ